ncbi:MAG: hypothetical protein M3071_15570 [Actinomycetota bacterium]|nr:hypothetical protein [Actinomycetota bacterium]
MCAHLGGPSNDDDRSTFGRPAARPATPGFVLTSEITASDPGGSVVASVAIQGNTTVDGAPFDPVSGHLEQAAAFVFVEPTRLGDPVIPQSRARERGDPAARAVGMARTSPRHALVRYSLPSQGAPAQTDV